jgi:XTP/dITP diphosphohydrolase
MRIALATKNRHKLEEMRAILADLPVELVSAADVGAPDVVEDAATLRGNAAKKAEAVADHARCWALADDTGLEVDALGGAPGVFSARYAGPGATYADNVAKLLRALEDVPAERRTARFRCVIFLASPHDAARRPDGRSREGCHRDGVLEGAIAAAPRGAHGFGYDPIFLVGGDAAGRTLAELPPEEKNRLSHRARALAKIKSAIAEIAPAAG